ncbi:hypothetical protein [Sporosarcina sp. USHLN248]|uniref:hypothetical protein n=1 Tax=Sporosarcina sp. USHLN248 TaxID=3081300 RepID=UPI003016A194
MNIVITSSKLQYKANDGGISRRIPEHFVKRSVIFEVDGEERRIDIVKSALPISATEDEVVAYIADNLSESTVTQQELKKLQETVDQLVLDQLMRGMA